jgi:hypothetical protein
MFAAERPCAVITGIGSMLVPFSVTSDWDEGRPQVFFGQGQL